MAETSTAASARITFRASSPPNPIFNPANPTVCQYNCTNELNYFAHTVGFGFRYATPVGPIRIDLGFPINRPRFVAPHLPERQRKLPGRAKRIPEHTACRVPNLFQPGIDLLMRRARHSSVLPLGA